MTLSWEIPQFDEDIFDPEKSRRFAVITYSTDEIDKIIEFLNYFKQDYPVCFPVIQLLETTYHFRCATTQEKYFADMRKHSKTDADLKLTLETMAKAIKTAQEELNKLNKNSEEYKFLSSGIQYCEETIKRRIEELKLNKDAIYEKHWQRSMLQTILKI